MKFSGQWPVVSGQRSRRAAGAPFVRRGAMVLALMTAIVLFMGAGDDLQKRFNDLGHRMMCRCGCNQVLLECNHVGCTYSDKMRGELMAGLQKGENDDLILQGFVQEYGAVVLAAPTTTGFGRVAWVMPFVALFAGLALVVIVVRQWRHVPAEALAGAPTPDAATDGYRDRIREETEV